MQTCPIRGCMLLLVTLLGACAGIGVIETSDPAQKLRDAEVLYDKEDRPLIAERLIQEAIEIYQSKNDKQGLADAYSQYGFLLRSHSVSGTWAAFYRQRGFLDKSVTFDTRYLKSVGYFEIATSLFAEQQRFDRATNASLNQGYSYVLMANNTEACRSFDRAHGYYEDNIRLNPDAKPSVPKGFVSYDDFSADVKRKYGCP